MFSVCSQAFLAYLRGIDRGIGWPGVWLLARYVANPGGQSPDQGWPWAGLRSSTALDSLVQGQPAPPRSGYYHSRIASERRCSAASGRSTASMVENDLDRRLVVAQSASPKTISTENEKELPACLTTGAPLRSWSTYVNCFHDLLTDSTTVQTWSCGLHH
jgi:hypothetical protein